MHRQKLIIADLADATPFIFTPESANCVGRIHHTAASIELGIGGAYQATQIMLVEARSSLASEERENNMSAENEKVFRGLIEEGFNRGNLSALDAFFAPGFIEHQAGFSPPNVEGVKGAIVSLRTPFPDLKLTIEEICVTGDMTWARITAHGTHQAPFMGRPPTGRSFVITVIDICRYEDNKMIEHWGVADRLGLVEQLGLMPRPPQETAH